MTAPWSQAEPIDRDQLYEALAEYSSYNYADGLLAVAELHVEHVIGDLICVIDDQSITEADNADGRRGRLRARQVLQDRLDQMRVRRGYDEDESVRRTERSLGLRDGS